MSGRREEILDAALAIADERGLEAVSMRALAERVGVTPMALYRHVKDKAALLDGMVGRLLSALLPTDAAQGAREPTWDERLDALAHACRQVTQRHPWAAHLLFSRPAVTPDAVRAVDIIYLALLEAGVPDSEVPRLERLISTFVIGFATSEASGRFTPGALDPRGRRGQLPDSELPGHSRLGPWLDLPVDLTAEFEADLADIRRLVLAAARGDE
ncbi:TetR/AcrR family transcriptional regulator [Streptomyces griseorubiginosus]|uniref:TetR/AcrR family transcriptional regulator n=1 Tax=Streptomyces griseorubiginosus TaxID=67304 RepID=UPI002E8236E8|nr:TetR/AcrR family transcriptional regulator [Streptomyces griseorubiginosus]WUB49431.1 TetR/AcrR family transcriptional regulator [Streptomyces griseorubiginosus]WUB57960.1 TetR/AcrR family transcriptional regulator [Streptomyces griseorubiginosus]